MEEETDAEWLAKLPLRLVEEEKFIRDMNFRLNHIERRWNALLVDHDLFPQK